jgi:RNA polymerase sigma factor (sigma-70 family)
MADADLWVGARAEDLDLLDEAAFAEWVRPHVLAMARLAARLAPGAEREDIVQEALFRAWWKRRLFDPGRGSPSGWLLAITADQARKHRRRRLLPSVIGESPKPASVDDWIDIEDAVRRLAPRQRLAVDCFCFVGLSVAETAEVMRCSQGTVKSTLSDARARLRTLLEPRR